MHYEWLKKKSAQKVIVVFSGWGFSSIVFDCLLKSDDLNQYDVLFVFDYQQLSLQLPDLSHYQERYLLAWSFGVSAFATWLSNLPTEKQLFYSQLFDRYIAVGGSMKPVDRYYGIPEVIVKKTIDTLSQKSFESFSSRCFGDLSVPVDSPIDVDVKRQELQEILVRKHAVIAVWDLVWIAKYDKIFPPKNLRRAWQSYNEKHQESVIIQYVDAPHAPFQLFSTWGEIISEPA